MLAELRHNVQLPRQVVIEMHIRPDVGNTMIETPAARTPAQMALLFMHMANLGECKNSQ